MIMYIGAVLIVMGSATIGFTFGHELGLIKGLRTGIAAGLNARKSKK